MLQITETEVAQRQEFDNPWWAASATKDEGVAQMPRRLYFQPFLNLLLDKKTKRAVVLLGPRRVGKTVMVQQAIQALCSQGVPGNQILYLSLDTPVYTGLSMEKLMLLFAKKFGHLKGKELFIFFDEVQYLSLWEVHLKSLVDSYPQYRFCVTGSSAAALRLKSKESGAGRFTDFLLPPLTFAEYLDFVGKTKTLIMPTESDLDKYYSTINIKELNEEFINYLNFGGYPEAVFNDTIRQDSGRFIKSDIIEKVLLRDLPSLYGIQDIQELNRLFTSVAYNTGNEVSLEDLAKSSGVAKNTLKRYLEYLEAAFLIRRVDRIDRAAHRFKRATTFKVYLTNPSMRAALFGYVQDGVEAMGALVETAIYSQWFHADIFEHLYYARWNTGEIDLVSLTKEGSPGWVTEVKWSDRPASDNSLMDSLVDFWKDHKIEDTPMITTKTITGVKDYRGCKVEMLPSALLAYTLGKNILRHKSLRSKGLA